MPDTLTLTNAPVAAKRTDRPTREAWTRRMIDGQLDDPPGYVWPKGAKRELLGFALALASFNRDGVNLHPTLPRLADRAGCSESQARRNRAELWRLGFVEKVSVADHGGPILAICDPPNYTATVRTLSPMTGEGVIHDRQNVQENKQSVDDVRAVAHDTPCFGQGKEQTSSDPVTHDTPATDDHAAHGKAYMIEMREMHQGVDPFERFKRYPDCETCAYAVHKGSPDMMAMVERFRTGERDDPWASEPDRTSEFEGQRAREAGEWPVSW